MAHYVKVFDSIIHSTVWQEKPTTKVVWITMLALADSFGEVQASIPGLAKASGVSVPECEEALSVFLRPDPYSRSKTAEGRRIEEIPGGWELINYSHYRALKSVEQEKELSALRSQRYRDRKDPSRSVTVRHGESRQEEEEEDVKVKEEEKGNKRTPPTPSQAKGKSRRSRKQIIEGFSPEVVEVVNVLIDEWPSVDPSGGRKITVSPAEFGQRVSEIMTTNENITPEILLQAGRDYIHSDRGMFKAPQYFFGPGRGTDSAPWLAYVKAALAVSQ